MPSVKETHEFVPDPKKPTYYVFVWGVPHSTTNPSRPQQIFRADTWLEAQSFARVFASLTMLQYATATALAPEIPDEMGGHGEKLARENYWQQTKGNVTFDRYTMPVSRVEQLQEEFPQGAAYETDPAERMKKAKEMMKKASPGDTLADVLAREWDRERQEKSLKTVQGLFRHGDLSKKQGRLTPIKKPKKRQGLSKRELDELLSLKEGRPYEPGKAPTPRVRIEIPKVVEPARKFSQPEMDFLESAFKTIISRKLRRDPFPAEFDQFEKLLATMEAMSPPLKFVSATRRVEDLARGLAAKGTPGRIVVRRGQSRVNELMQKSLKSALTEEEQEELARLEGREEAPEEIFEREEVYYEKPRIKLIAEGGPVPPFAGAPLEHGKDYPRNLGDYWTIEIAELNAANFARKGYKVRLEQEK